MTADKEIRGYYQGALVTIKGTPKQVDGVLLALKDGEGTFIPTKNGEQTLQEQIDILRDLITKVSREWVKDVHISDGRLNVQRGSGETNFYYFPDPLVAKINEILNSVQGNGISYRTFQVIFPHLTKEKILEIARRNPRVVGYTESDGYITMKPAARFSGDEEGRIQLRKM